MQKIFKAQYEKIITKFINYNSQINETKKINFNLQMVKNS